MNLDVQFPRKLAFLLEAKRYKILHGGRGGAKSWGVARALLSTGRIKPIRVLCCREYQNSIKESVHRLLVDQIGLLAMDDFYEIQSTSIKGRNGTEFSFEGLRHNATKIKSYEGVDICWVEQAERVSKTSWDILIPTIRKANSEIWLTMNPELETDEAYQRFIVRPPSESTVVKVNWSDNPWFPDVLKKEMDDLRERDRDSWLNIWEGHCRIALDGAIYAKELRIAQEQNRICKVEYDERYPVHTAWDLGHSDSTCIWFFQRVGFQYRFIDYHHGNQQKISDYLKMLQNKNYVYGRDFLPHDAEDQHMQDSIASLIQRAGRKIKVVEKTKNVANDINTARTIFSNCYFDQEKCADGLQCLRHYRFEVDPNTGDRSLKPLHDWSSDGADAFRTFAVGYRPDIDRSEKKTIRTRMADGDTSWMAS